VAPSGIDSGSRSLALLACRQDGTRENIQGWRCRFCLRRGREPLPVPEESNSMLTAANRHLLQQRFPTAWQGLIMRAA
jgi:hypothetical protein